MTVPFLSVLPRSIKLKVSPRFPAQLIGRTGINVVKANGNYFLDLDYGDFPPVPALPANPNLYALVWDIVANQYTLVAASQFGGSGGIAEAPSDGFSYGRNSAVWQRVLALGGGTLTGPLILAADPATALGAATKQYVDNAVVGGGITDAPNDGSTYGRKNLGWSKALDLSGGTLTGPLILGADPSAALGAATKQYFDNRGVRYDAAQSLSGAQQIQGRSNVGMALGHILGEPGSGAPASGEIGEYVSASATANLTSGVATNITSIPVPAGDWDVFAGYSASGGGSPSVTDIWVSVNTVSATGVNTAGQSFRIRGTTLTDPVAAGCLGPLRLMLAAPQTWYLNTTVIFTGAGATFSVGGLITVRRAR